jgi:hypothetical protein
MIRVHLAQAADDETGIVGPGLADLDRGQGGVPVGLLTSRRMATS